MHRSTAIPAAFVAACGGIALYSVMDAAMKALAIAMGAYVALFWRMGAGTLMSGALYLATRPRLPGRRVVRVHLARAAVVAVMTMSFFWGIVRVPLAEAIALSFIAPLNALALAAIFLKERIGARAVFASLIGLAGVGVILAGRLGAAHGPDALAGIAAVLVSAVFYAINLVMARHQAQLAGPLEIAAFQNLFALGFLALPAPWLLALPPAGQWPLIAGAAALAIVSLLLLSWAYARAEAQILLSVEYTAFLWASLMGWWFFGEALTLYTILGTILIVAGCLIAARRPAGGAPEAETALP